MCCAVVKWEGVRDEVVKLEEGRMSCKREGDYISEAFGHPPHVHVVDELLFDGVGEGTLHIQKEHHRSLTLPLGIFDLVNREHHGIQCVLPQLSSKLGGWEQSMFL